MESEPRARLGRVTLSLEKPTEHDIRRPIKRSAVRNQATAAATALLRALGIGKSEEPSTPEAQIQVLLQAGARAGFFDDTESQMVRRVFRLGRQRAGVLMTPMKEVVWLDVSDSPELMMQKIQGSPHGRFPVCEGSIDAILGVVQVKDLLIQSFTGKPFGIKGLLMLPLFIYEGTPGLKVLEMFKETGTHIAVIISEYGSVVGLLTMNDILKAIVGDMPTDLDSARPKVEHRQDGSWRLDGMLTLDEFSDVTGLANLPTGDYHTLAGFIVARLGHIPVVSERLEWGGFRFEVAGIDGHRVNEVVVARLAGS